jgi:hypothetical protein
MQPEMTKKDWEELYVILEGIYSDFKSHYHDVKTGKNKKNRQDAERRAASDIKLAEIHIRKRGEIFDLLTGQPGTDGYSRAIMYDEFTMLKYFEGDIQEFLGKIKSKIEGYPSTA